VQVDQFVVMQVIHDVNLFADQSLLHGMRDGDELGCVDVTSLDLSATVDHAKGASSNFLQDVIGVIHTLQGLSYKLSKYG